MKTRKHRNNVKKKLSGGNNNNTDEIMRQVVNDKKINFNLGDLPVVKKANDLLSGLTVKGINRISELLGVDLSNSKNINEKLDEIKIALADPKNREKLKEVVREAAENGAIMLEAATPFIQPLVDKTIKVGTESASKIGEAAIKIALNTAEEIPVAGVVIGTVRSLSNAGEAALSASNAASQIIASTSDTVNAASKNYEKIMKEKMKEKMDSMNRISQSVGDFQKPISKEPQTRQDPNKLTGGNNRKLNRNTKYKKYKKNITYKRKK
jgi:hypothetical protein